MSSGLCYYTYMYNRFAIYHLYSSFCFHGHVRKMEKIFNNGKVKIENGKKAKQLCNLCARGATEFRRAVLFCDGKGCRLKSRKIPRGKYYFESPSGQRHFCHVSFFVTLSKVSTSCTQPRLAPLKPVNTL